MTSPQRSDHLTVYGLVGVAMHLVVGVVIGASFSVISAGWMVFLALLWIGASVASWVFWDRTVWIPLLASVLMSAIWMSIFFGSR